MKICVFGASSNEIDSSYIEVGELLGEKIAENHHTLVFGAGATGLMGAVVRGVHRKNGQSIGVSPKFFNKEGVLFNQCSELIFTDTMSERKDTMEKISDAYIITPGGIGTLDEFFEVFTLNQLEVAKKPIALLNTNNYYDELDVLLENMVNKGFMSKECLDYYYMSNDIDNILDYLKQYQ
jgi:hypothetical protein